jgi:hypothetical protein
MSRITQKLDSVEINKTELKCIITRHFKDQKEFCEKYDLNHGTMRHYINGRNMPSIDQRVLEIIETLGYNPDGSLIPEPLPSIDPDLKLHLAANNG